jgi:glutamate dehydrogenase
VIVFKDASANKGGVTSSSLEVLAALALADEDFDRWMSVKGDKTPTFYAAYVDQVLEKIDDNAKQEFECIWRENIRTGTQRTILTDQLSNQINEINDAIQKSDLDQDQRLFEKILKEACPMILIEKVGLEALLKRVPNNYLKAMFGAHLASRYVYRYGMSATPVDFVEFVKNY